MSDVSNQADSLAMQRRRMTLDYHFTPRELSVMARFLRSRATELPDALIDFYAAVERTVYDSLSIDEAEQFYS